MNEITLRIPSRGTLIAIGISVLIILGGFLIFSRSEPAFSVSNRSLRINGGIYELRTTFTNHGNAIGEESCVVGVPAYGYVGELDSQTPWRRKKIVFSGPVRPGQRKIVITQTDPFTWVYFSDPEVGDCITTKF